MKEKFLNNSISKIKKKNPNFSEEKLEEIAYGLEAIYLTVTKIVIIFILAFILGIFKDMLIIMIFYTNTFFLLSILISFPLVSTFLK